MMRKILLDDNRAPATVLRGEESDADELFVRAFCAERDIPLHVYRADVASLAKANGESTELTARKVRYDFFSTIGVEKIATAHTGSDTVETLLIFWKVEVIDTRSEPNRLIYGICVTVTSLYLPLFNSDYSYRLSRNVD